MSERDRLGKIFGPGAQVPPVAPEGGRLRQVARVLIVTLGLNLGVALAKVAYGLWSRSLAVLADGLHSITDASSNVLGLLAIRVAARPPDREHPYGHQKFETFGASVVAMLLFLGCYEIAKQAIGRFQAPVPPRIGATGFWVMAITMLVNVATTLYERREGRRLGSELLLADSLHTRLDVFVSAAVLLSLGASRVGYPVFDLIIALGICAFLATASFRILRQNLTILADASILDPRQVVEAVRSVDGVTGCHKVRTRGRPHQIFMDLHIQVEAGTDTARSHAIVHSVQDRLRQTFPGLADILIHTEPTESGSGFSGE
jgi:cation diffusion facilitator family transporter